MPDSDESRYVLPPVPAEAGHGGPRCDLLRHRGADGFSTADVLDAVGVDLDQVDESITSDLGLVLERVNELLYKQEALLRDQRSLEGLHRWRDEMVRDHASDTRAGCPLGTPRGMDPGHHQGARIALRAGFDTW